MARNRTRCVNEKFKKALERASLERFVRECWVPSTSNPNTLLRVEETLPVGRLNLQALIQAFEEFAQKEDTSAS